jgi:NIMA (never in mitosis gene a)-related kinase
VILNASVPTGAFGTAVLYHKVADDKLVVIKEVNMIDLTASERQMALNEVQVLSSLDHPNIIR